MGWLIVLVLMVLFFVMMFGIGFILNMLMKTTWFPAYIFVIVILPIVVYSLWDHELGFGAYLASFRVVDYLTALAGLAGAVLSGWTIKKLRLGGYKMF
ncbi:YuiB family protein [Paenibacillus sp. M1]|uniref:YuiB family protein n=1 Tax=Paenibacillus haidiansis TaxID=1574488 RepID=A0ABU7VXM5_9BACL